MKQKHILQTPCSFGKVKLPHRIFYAPLAGCSDYPFRQMSAHFGPALMFCEMVKMEALIRNEPRTLRMLEYNASMRPIGAQICGSNPAIAGQSAKIIEELGFDTVDLNCGCPVDKVTKDGSGSGMLKTPERIGEVISNMVAAVSIPVTVKIRAGWDTSSINAAEITQIAEQAGAKAICIHGRTREQAYRGPANWDYIKACKQVARHIQIIGNGDLFSPEAVAKMVDHTGCDAVLVSRGTMGQPWIAQDILGHLEGQPKPQRTVADYRQTLFEHYKINREHHPERWAILNMRRVGCWYFKKSANTRAFRELISKAKTLTEIEDLILNFPIGEFSTQMQFEPEEAEC